MDELSAAIEAAAAAAVATSQSPPKSPEVKMEIKHEASSPVIAPSPTVTPVSPLKRARSPLDDIGRNEEKRQKTDGEGLIPDTSSSVKPEAGSEASRDLRPAPDLQRTPQATLIQNPPETADPTPPSERQAIPESQPAPEPQPVSEPQPAPESQPLSESQPASETHPVPEPRPEPETQAVDAMQSAPGSNSAPENDSAPNAVEDSAADIAALIAAHEAEQMPDIAHSMADLDEITKMIQAAQEAALGTEHMSEDHTMPDFHTEMNGTHLDHEHDLDLGRLMASITSSLEHGGDDHDNGNLNHEIGPEVVPTPELISSAPTAAKKTTIWSNRAQYTRQTHILPTLGKVAVDILVSLSDQLLEETITALNDPESPIGKEYGLLRSFFDTLRKQFSEDFPLLYPDQLDITSSEDREIIRIANLATSCASMFGANELGWPDLNASFLSTFVADGQQMADEEAKLYLGLKTQMFLTLLESEQPKSNAQILDELFLTGQKDALRKHHPDLPLAPSETAFLADAEARKAMLLEESLDSASIQLLSHKYTYEAFLEELGGYLEHNMANIEQLGSSPTSVSADADSVALFDGVEGLDNFDIDAAIAEAAKAAQEAVGNNGVSGAVPDDLAALISFASEQAQGQPGATDMPSNVLSTSESAMRATNLALQTMQRNQYHPTTVQQANTASSNTQHSSHQPQQTSPPQPQQQPPQPQQQPQQQQYYAYPQQPNGVAQQPQSSDRVELPPGQHASSEILYERARQAAAARSSTHARREGSHSTRRPWSPEEEKALMMGLDMVKGPHWSQILSLFGPQGRMSNILADRTQVQLKDKARNLKLFFLKTNSEMPYYLQCVTGELKTRAPTQAARKEAEERARLTSEDDKSHVSATMALGNLHNGHAQRTQPKPAPPKGATPGQAVAHGQSHPGSPHTSQLQRTASGHAAVPISAQPATSSGQNVHVAQAGQKVHAPMQHQQVQQVAPRPSQQPQNHVPLKPLQQHPQVQQSQHQSSPVHGLQHQTLHNQQRQPSTQQHHPQQPQAPLHQQQQLKQIQHQSHTQSQLQHPPQFQPPTQQHTPAQPRTQSQAQSQHQLRPQNQAQNTPVQAKADEPAVKPEPLNEEEAGLLELKRFMSQENIVETQDQSIEAALAAASAAAAAVAAGPS